MSAENLDPVDWDAFRSQAHAMLDDMLDFTQHIRERPVWQVIPAEIRASFREPLPTEPAALTQIHARFMRDILPYSAGNAHPGFMGWVNGGGTPVGMLAEMLAAGLNTNLGGRDQIPVEVERQLALWVRDIFGFPEGANGLHVTGTSMANFIAVLIARTARLGLKVRQTGLGDTGARLVGYTSSAAHLCIAKAMDMSGLGSNALRIIAVNRTGQIDLDALQSTIAQDRAAGLTPFFLAGTAGTVDIGAIDDLGALADIARAQSLWFHVDGAFGALAMLSLELAPLLSGIERADSIAFDFHKWGQVPYDAGYILVRDGAAHQATFDFPAAYLRRETRGLAAGSPWPCDLGPDLSRSFRALKTWVTLQSFGTRKLGQMIRQSCAVAQYLKQKIAQEAELELMAPVALNIVCFRFRCAHADDVNRRIAIALQESGIVAPSTTFVGGALAIRAAIVNHRTGFGEMDALVKATLAFGAQLRDT